MYIGGFLIPLVQVPVKELQEVTADEACICVEAISTEAIGMGGEVSQGVDEDGLLNVYLPYKSEVAIHYFGYGGQSELSRLANQLRLPSVLEQNQKAIFGIGTLGKIEKTDNVEIEGESIPHAVFHLTVHYTERLYDDVGAIETIKAAHESGETTIHLTR